MHSAWIGRSQSRGKGHLSQEENTKALQLEVDQLKRKLRHAQRRQASSSLDASPDGEEDGSYRRRSKTPPSESFSYEEEHHHKHRHKYPLRKGVETTLWARRWIKSPSCLSREELSEQNSPGSSLNLRLPCIVARQTP